jgi:hypothetical protein
LHGFKNVGRLSSLTIFNNSVLNDTWGLANVPSVVGAVAIQANPYLPSIGLSSLVYCSTLTITNNTRLRNLNGLESFRQLTSISGAATTLYIAFNGNLGTPMSLDGLTGPISFAASTCGITIKSNDGLTSWGNSFINQENINILNIIVCYRFSSLNSCVSSITSLDLV